jgi:hypothetical protein
LKNYFKKFLLPCLPPREDTHSHGVTAHGHVGDRKKHQVNIVEELGGLFKGKIATLEVAFGF